jgi:hypothetical protein
MTIAEHTFQGYDYWSSGHFRGQINGHKVSSCDYSGRGFFNFAF